MLSIKKVEKADNAKHYFEKDNYYTEGEGIERSEWFGEISKDLKLDGKIDPDKFHSLLQGQFEDAQLGRVIDGKIKHTPAWDCTFSAPKSLSILAEACGDQDLKRIHNEAVKEALKYIENEAAQTRIKSNNQSENIKTKKLCVAMFTHDTSRELDPQLHTHCVVMNATKIHQKNTNKKDGLVKSAWRSLNSKPLYDIKMEAGMYYRNALAIKLKKLGYDIEITGKHGLFEIQGFDDKTLKLFSKRRMQIENYLLDNNLSFTPQNSQLAALKTRKIKTDVDRKELYQYWNKKVIDSNISIENYKQDHAIKTNTAKNIVNKALRLLSEKDMAFKEDSIIESCLNYDLGNASKQQIKEEINRLKDEHILIVKGDDLLTTRQGIRIEKSIIKNMKLGEGEFKAVKSDDESIQELESTMLNSDQKGAIELTLKSKNRFIGIQGSAGAGKTTALSLLNNILLKRGYKVEALAPTHTAVSALDASLKCNTSTVDSFLLAKKSINKDKPAFWIVDEASFLSAKKIKQIQTQAMKLNARVILVGDHQQLESIQAGRAFKQMQDHGLETAIIKTVMRQKNEELKEAVTLAVKENFTQSLNKISSSIIANDDYDLRMKQMVQEWMKYDPQERDDVLMIAPSNVERKATNKLTHSELKESKELGQKSLLLSTLNNENLSGIETRNTQFYTIGHQVKFRRDYKSTSKYKDDSISKDDYYKVVAINRQDNELTLVSQNNTIVINPAKRGGNKLGGISVYSEEKIEINVGERIRATEHNKKLKYPKNEGFKVLEINGHELKLKSQESDEVIRIDTHKKNNRHFTYNYANTVYNAQGKTCNHVLALADSKRLNLINRKSFYVTISRARHSATLFTDNKKEFINGVLDRFGDNTMALNKEVSKEKKDIPLI